MKPDLIGKSHPGCKVSSHHERKGGAAKACRGGGRPLKNESSKTRAKGRFAKRRNGVRRVG